MINKEEGFTLIEVIIAMVIMGIGFSIFIQGFMEINNGLENKLNYTYLSNWATIKLDELESQIELNGHGSFKYREQLYKWHIEEAYINPKLKKLKIVISWKASNRRKKYSLSRVVINKN